MTTQLHAYYASTDEGLELLTGVVTMRPCMVSNHGVQEPMYQVMYPGSLMDEGTFVYDFVNINATHDLYQEFLNKHITKHGGI